MEIFNDREVSRQLKNLNFFFQQIKYIKKNCTYRKFKTILVQFFF